MRGNGTYNRSYRIDMNNTNPNIPSREAGTHRDGCLRHHDVRPSVFEIRVGSSESREEKRLRDLAAFQQWEYYTRGMLSTSALKNLDKLNMHMS